MENSFPKFYVSYLVTNGFILTDYTKERFMEDFVNDVVMKKEKYYEKAKDIQSLEIVVLLFLVYNNLSTKPLL